MDSSSPDAHDAEELDDDADINSWESLSDHDKNLFEDVFMVDPLDGLHPTTQAGRDAIFRQWLRRALAYDWAESVSVCESSALDSKPPIMTSDLAQHLALAGTGSDSQARSKRARRTFELEQLTQIIMRRDSEPKNKARKTASFEIKCARAQLC
jgi:hypothetical protein